MPVKHDIAARLVEKEVELSPKNSAHFALPLPQSLKKALEEATREGGTSLNQFLVVAAAEKLSAMKTAEAFISDRRDRADVQAALKLLNHKGGQEPAPEDAL